MSDHPEHVLCLIHTAPDERNRQRFTLRWYSKPQKRHRSVSFHTEKDDIRQIWEDCGFTWEEKTDEHNTH